MRRYKEVLVGGKAVRKHVRDIEKDRAIMRLLPGQGLDIYEASAGLGGLARVLADAGHRVVVSNFRSLGLEGLDEREADLNRDLPFADGQFDAIVCREVIEHVESAPHTLREFNRCLRPGGRLVLTFPNRLHIRSRFYHLLTCFYRGMKSPINLDVPFGEAHINLIGYPEMDYFLRHAGFKVLGVDTAQTQVSDYLLLALAPLFRLVTMYYLLEHKKRAQEHD
ncbi:MAG: methyltransferase domain-containing protein, partial [Desulfovibrionaceae bacterium]|nr:methyltransferase domain-containing protein [Desulfovibrionaceae bacterium]